MRVYLIVACLFLLPGLASAQPLPANTSAGQAFTFAPPKTTPSGVCACVECKCGPAGVCSDGACPFVTGKAPAVMPALPYPKLAGKYLIAGGWYADTGRLLVWDVAVSGPCPAGKVPVYSRPGAAPAVTYVRVCGPNGCQLVPQYTR